MSKKRVASIKIIWSKNSRMVSRVTKGGPVLKAHVDADVILRFVLGAPEDQALASRALFDQAAKGCFCLVIHPAVLAEVIYVLTSLKLAAHPRHRVADVLGSVCGLDGVVTDNFEVALRALAMVADTRLDFVDCLMLGYAPELPVFTFDQEMVKAGGLMPPPGGCAKA